ncbi:MAG: FtsW/RodA/SpoVE family cell cycle protein, partial [Porphyrobacter sp.]|nr:FtsW/RodA/SpoVE family cell cycle protein [Porphyrobacter sp.]
MARTLLPQPIATLPWRVLLPLTLLTCFGAAVLYSAAGGAMYPYAAPHLMRFAMFVVLAVAISYAPPDFVRWAVYPVYGAVCLLLILVEALGHIAGGGQRWLTLGPLVLQPSELMKPTIVLVLASFYNTLPAGMVSNWRSLIPPALLIGFPM